MRLVSMLIGIGILVAGSVIWRLDAVEKRRLESSVRILTLKKFEPFVADWISAHPDEFSHPIIIDVADNPKFRYLLQSGKNNYDAFFADALGNSGVHLRRLDRLMSFFGGPLKLLVREGMRPPLSSQGLVDIWTRLEDRVVGVLPLETPLGLDTFAWMKEAGLLSSSSNYTGIISGQPTIRVYANSLELLQALHQQECDAAILRADLNDPPGTSAWAWHRLHGVPEEHYAMGLLVTLGSPYRTLLGDLWMELQPDLETYKRLNR